MTYPHQQMEQQRLVQATNAEETSAWVESENWSKMATWCTHELHGKPFRVTDPFRMIITLGFTSQTLEGRFNYRLVYSWNDDLFDLHELVLRLCPNFCVASSLRILPEGQEISFADQPEDVLSPEQEFLWELLGPPWGKRNSVLTLLRFKLQSRLVWLAQLYATKRHFDDFCIWHHPAIVTLLPLWQARF